MSMQYNISIYKYNILIISYLNIVLSATLPLLFSLHSYALLLLSLSNSSKNKVYKSKQRIIVKLMFTDLLKKYNFFHKTYEMFA